MPQGGHKKGRDEDAIVKLLAEIESPEDAAMMNIVLADSVYTPPRAHIRWGEGDGLQLLRGSAGRLGALHL